MFRNRNEPIFDGWGDVENYLEWEREMDRIFGYHPFTSQERVAKAIEHLTGRALIWWENNVEIARIRRSEPSISTWTSMKHELRSKFVPYSHFTVLRRRFRKIFQGSNSVEKYYREHRQLQSLLGIDYPEWELMEHFMGGLNDETYRMAQRRPHRSPRELVRYITETSLEGKRRATTEVSQPTPTPRYDPGLSFTPNPVPSLPEMPQSDGDLVTSKAEPLVEEGNDVPMTPESPPGHDHDSPVQISNQVNTDEERPISVPMKVNHHVVSLEDAPTEVERVPCLNDNVIVKVAEQPLENLPCENTNVHSYIIVFSIEAKTSMELLGPEFIGRHGVPVIKMVRPARSWSGEGSKYLGVPFDPGKLQFSLSI